MKDVDALQCESEVVLQWSLCFKTAHGTMPMWSYIAYGLKIEVQWYTELNFGTNNMWSNNGGGLKIKGCKIGGALYGYK